MRRWTRLEPDLVHSVLSSTVHPVAIIRHIFDLNIERGHQSIPDPLGIDLLISDGHLSTVFAGHLIGCALGCEELGPPAASLRSGPK
jgi:hypothetical protein